MCVCQCYSMCCRETLWSFSSQLITPWDQKTRCDSAQCSSASGTGILIDVKATKYSERWWVLCTDRVRKMVSVLISLKQCKPNILILKSLQTWKYRGGDIQWACVFNGKKWSSWDSYISVSICVMTFGHICHYTASDSLKVISPAVVCQF